MAAQPNKMAVAEQSEPKETTALNADNEPGQGAGEGPATSTEMQERQREKRVNWIIAVFSIMHFFIALDYTNRYAAITTVERRFGFQTTNSGVIVSAFDFGHVIMLIGISIMGNKVHRPRACAVAGGFLACISGLMFALPHFLFGDGRQPPAAHVTSASASSVIGLTSTTLMPWSSNVTSVTDPKGLGLLPDNMLCRVFHVNSSHVGDGCDVTADVTAGVSASESAAAFAILTASQSVIGMALAPLMTIAISYLDDNTSTSKSGLGVTIILGVHSVGTIAGFLLGAVYSTIPANLHSSDLKPGDSGWVGAWWLGSAICAVCIFLAGLPLFFFPRQLKHDTDDAEELNRLNQGVNHTKNSQSPPSRRSPSHHPHRIEHIQSALQRHLSTLSIDSIGSRQEVQRESLSLMRNVTYVCTTLCFCALMYFPTSLFPFVPKYLETHFHVSTGMANVLTSVITTLAMTLGTFIGGWIASRRDLDLLGLVKLSGAGCLAAVIFLGGAMFSSCPSSELVLGEQNRLPIHNLTAVCDTSCACVNQMLPVCGSDGRSYLSPCQAGCHGYLAGELDDHNLFTNCSCVSDHGAGPTPGQTGWVEPGWCRVECHSLIPYSVLMFLAIFSMGLGDSPRMAVIIRSVKDNEKSLALGVSNMLGSLLSSIPGPMLYGRMIDMTCVVNEKSCDDTGACALHDATQFRFLIHGFTLTCLVLAVAFTFIVFARLRRESKLGEEKMANGAKYKEEVQHIVYPLTDMVNGSGKCPDGAPVIVA